MFAKWGALRPKPPPPAPDVALEPKADNEQTIQQPIRTWSLARTKLYLEKTEGIPFFIEEFVKSLKDLQYIQKKENIYRITKVI